MVRRMRQTAGRQLHLKHIRCQYRFRSGSSRLARSQVLGAGTGSARRVKGFNSIHFTSVSVVGSTLIKTIHQSIQGIAAAGAAGAAVFWHHSISTTFHSIFFFVFHFSESVIFQKKNCANAGSLFFFFQFFCPKVSIIFLCIPFLVSKFCFKSISCSNFFVSESFL
jgi:hypothetical protein